MSRPEEGTAASRYQALSAKREPFLRRAREAAKLTVQSLLPPEGHTSQSKLYTPFQSIGARGLNNLSAKLHLTLLPPNSPFFRLQVDDFTLEKVTNQQGMRGEVEKALNKVERAVMTKVETAALRAPSAEAIKQVVLAGNVLIHMTAECSMRVFNLDRYVVSRDPAGNILEIITKESVAPGALPLDVQTSLPKEVSTKSSSTERTLDLYTHVKRSDGRWNVYQEIRGFKLPKSKGWYPLDKCPWIALRWSRIDGESYGRGYVEEYLGDLYSLDCLMKAIVEGSAAAAKILILVDPNGTTSADVVANAPSGSVRSGSKNDVSVLQLDKYADFNVALRTIEMLEQRLSIAFMLNSAIQRPGERVTAEEIRYMAGELEDALGGVYALLSQEFQLPLVTNLLVAMEKSEQLPPLPKDLVRPSITTGLEAIGRGHDMSKLDQLVGGIMQAFGPQVLNQYLNIGEYITRRGTALGLDMAGLVRSEEEQAQAQQEAQMMELMNKLGPSGMNILRDQLNPENQQSDGTAEQPQ